MDGDSTLKSMAVGRLGAAITAVVALLSLFGYAVTGADVADATSKLNNVLDNGFGLASAIAMAINTGQVLYSKYKKR